ncbi:mannosylglycoprotein endo-beta-mannosidase-like isoform X4 [Tripterygium wilfordii]|uniref:mannosylglycoprotein endo-beta-mannosidase-like isoform X4 n=1 Tax=Tripterygium wilfordii TaxID=458696 RepID=UPI0018F7F159|nr:mannosylglycoprotein endo-beta-mannosidase-like isoform X4 [Tripterygium wilfordii]
MVETTQTRKIILDSGWLAARSTEVELDGTQLTTTHPPTDPTARWMEAVVPGTVLGTLVKNKVVPDPFYGLKNKAIIDIGKSGRDHYTFWFFTTFQFKLSENQHTDLNFRAINYSAEVYLNGHKFVLPKGMFRRHSLDVTDFLHPDGQNFLAVLVYPPDHPGKIPRSGGQGGDHEIYLYKPHLWWPNGMGEQSLYNVTITVEVNGYGESDSWSHLHGFRKIESYIDSATGGRLFKVNGQPIFIRGGNWILSDGLLRLSEARYRTEIKYHADLNLNMIRCWGGGLAERPEFYRYCDIYGLLVWQEFWITGDVDGGSNGPLDHDLFMLCARDTVKLLRNHPSLALWVGGNEQVPPDDINTALKTELELHPHHKNVNETENSVHNLSASWKDPSEYLDSTRIYIQGSLWDGFADGQGGFTDGPYKIQNPESFFKDDFYSYGFNPEVGSVGMPVAATIRATMPPEGWTIPIFKKLSDSYIEETPNPIWEYHKYHPYSNPGEVHDQILLYGVPKDLDDFCLQAQLANYIQYRALLEGWNSHMWKKYTGVLIWKTQNPWTGLRGQFYDHLLDQTAGFYGCRCAAEPIHVQLNLVTYFIEIINTTSEELSDIAIEVSVWDLEGTCPYQEVHENLSIPRKKTVPITQMKYPKSKNHPKPVYFLLLKLYNMSDHSIISRNFYWLHLAGGDYKLLEPYRKKRIPLKVTSKTSIEGSTYEIEMQVQNTSKKLDSRGSSLNYKNNFIARHGDGDFDMTSLKHVHSRSEGKGGSSLFQRIFRNFSRESDGSRVVEINGDDVGVAFFLHLSVHVSKTDYKEGEDSRILPVHYSDNYFSLVPGEVMPINLSFDVPPGVTPTVLLKGWNYNGEHAVI